MTEVLSDGLKPWQKYRVCVGCFKKKIFAQFKQALSLTLSHGRGKRLQYA